MGIAGTKDMTPAWAANVDPNAARLIDGKPLANLTPDFMAQLKGAAPSQGVVGPDGLVYGQVGVQASGEDGNGFTQTGYQAIDPNHNVKGDAQGLFDAGGNFASFQSNANGKYDGWWAPFAVAAAAAAAGAAGEGAAGTTSEGAAAAGDTSLTVQGNSINALETQTTANLGGTSAASQVMDETGFNAAADSQLANADIVAAGGDPLAAYTAAGAGGVTASPLAGAAGSSLLSSVSPMDVVKGAGLASNLLGGASAGGGGGAAYMGGGVNGTQDSTAAAPAAGGSATGGAAGSLEGIAGTLLTAKDQFGYGSTMLS